MTVSTDPTQPCCPPFDPAPWQEHSFQWNNKLFIRDSIPQLFHIPFPPMIGKTLARLWKQAEEAGAAPDKKDFLCLAYDPSPWKCEFHVAVEREVPGADNVQLTGTFLTKVFDGPYRDVPKWLKAMEEYAAGKNQRVAKHYLHYTTCPKCAKLYGHNYTVAFAQLA